MPVSWRHCEAARDRGSEAVLALVCCGLLAAPWVRDFAHYVAVTGVPSPSAPSSSGVEFCSENTEPQGSVPTFKKTRKARIDHLAPHWNSRLVALERDGELTAYHRQYSQVPPRGRIVCNHDFQDGLGAPLLC